MGEKPTGYTIGRIDENRGYTKTNCEWQSRKTQSRHRAYCKLDIHKAKKIRELRKKGYSYKKLTAKFKVSMTTIGYVVQGRTWK